MDYYINNKLSGVRIIVSKCTIRLISPFTSYSSYIGKVIINLIAHLLAILLTPERILLIE
jgi:hypothetical protein